MPDPIASNSGTYANACYEPEPAAGESVCRLTNETPAKPTAADTSESSPAVQQLVNRSAPSPSLPNGIHAGSTGVLLCRRLADVPLKEYTKIQHHFIVTELKAAGAGHCGGGIPGHGQVDLPLSPMCIIDHSAEVGTPGVVCDRVEADPERVNRELALGRYIGRWAPPFNDCQTFAASLVADCGTRNPADSGSEGASGAEGARGY